ncbi:MAG: hypothetical protein GYA15_08560 [Leptolinea sp.]|jgi:hypothetical protein|nr:hypothetical protein [Leptolinea sp.]
MEENNSNYRPPKERHGIFFPLILLTAGVLLLLSNLGYLPGGFWGFVEVYWPILIIICGLDGLIRGNGITGSLLIAGIGVVLLAGNLGYISLSAWELLAKGWPLILIGIGLDIIIGKRTVFRSIFSLIMAFVLIAGLVWLANFSLSDSITTREFRQDYQNETELSLDISRAAGRIDLKSGGISSALVDADLSLMRNEHLEPVVNRENDRTSIKLNSDKNTFPGMTRRSDGADWEIRVHSKPVLSIKSDLAAGENRLDLRGLDVDSVTCETVAGQSDIYLAESEDASYRISGVTGKIIIHVPAGVPVVVETDKVLGNCSIPNGYSRVDGRIFSSEYQDGKPAVHVRADLVVGAIHIVEDGADL